MSAINLKYKKIDGIYRPIIPIEITHTKSILYEVLVDSGADVCIFHSEIAEAIGIENIESGLPRGFGGVTGKEEKAYMHKVTIKIKNCEYRTTVFFSNNIYDNGYGIVGQKGFFDYFRVTLDYAEKKVTLRKKNWT